MTYWLPLQSFIWTGQTWNLLHNHHHPFLLLSPYSSFYFLPPLSIPPRNKYFPCRSRVARACLWAYFSTLVGGNLDRSDVPFHTVPLSLPVFLVGGVGLVPIACLPVTFSPPAIFFCVIPDRQGQIFPGSFASRVYLAGLETGYILFFLSQGAFNMFFTTRRRILDGLNRRYIYGRFVCDPSPRALRCLFMR